MEPVSTEGQCKNAIIYRIYPKSFFDSDGDGIGDLKGITSKLPYLVSLGVDVIALSSLFESTSDDVVFAATDFCRIHPAIGAIEDYEELVSAAHEQGLKVYLSFPLVATSVSHPWFEKSKVKALNPYREYFTWKPGKSENGKAAPDNKKNSFKMPIWSYDAKCGEWYRCAFGSKYPELNYDNPRLRKDILDIFRFWQQKGTDGFIVENAYFSTKKLLLPDQKKLYKVSEDLFEDGKDLFRIIRDVKEKSEEVFPLLIDADGVDLKLYPYLLTNADSIVSENLIAVNRILAPDSFSLKSFVKDYLTLQASACVKKMLLSFEDKDHTRLLSKLVSVNDEDYLPAAKFLAALLLCSTAAPTLYQGQELGMTDFSVGKSDARSDVDPMLFNSRSAFQWDNNPGAAFTTAAFPHFPINENYHKINLLAESSDPDSVFSFYRKMIALRKGSSALSEGVFQDYSNSSLVCFVRESDTERLLFIANPTHKHVNVRTPATLLNEGARCELCNYNVVSKTLNATMGLRPYEVRIFRMKAPLLALN